MDDGMAGIDTLEDSKPMAVGQRAVVAKVDWRLLHLKFHVLKVGSSPLATNRFRVLEHNNVMIITRILLTVEGR